jgi:predicted esterase
MNKINITNNKYCNCKIITPKKTHLYTFILLHPMTVSIDYFDNLINNIKIHNNLSAYYDNIKFILPYSPIMDVDYPNNKQFNINSWYNYYTCNNNINELDIINLEHFNNQSLRIKYIIDNEKLSIHNKNIFICGVSQGGTLLFNILNKLNYNIGCIFCIKSIYMHDYIKLNKNRQTSIFIYSGKKDDVYTIEYQKKLINILKKNNFKINDWFIDNNIDHQTKSINEDNFIINKLYSIIQ